MTAVNDHHGPWLPSEAKVMLPSIAPETIAAFRPRMEPFSRRISAAICREVTAFKDPSLAEPVHEAISVAVELFVDVLAGVPNRGRHAAEHFRHLGLLKAKADADLDALQAAHRVAMNECCTVIQELGPELGLEPDEVRALSLAVLQYQSELHEQSVVGWASARAQRQCSPAEMRKRLHVSVLEGVNAADIARLVPSGWTLPSQLAVAATVNSEGPRKILQGLSAHLPLLWGVRRDSIIVLAPQGLLNKIAARMASCSVAPVAVTWEMPVDEVPHGLRWSLRALNLARSGCIPMPATRVVCCHEHRAELMRHADPKLGRQIAEEVLKPLEVETEHQQRELRETLLLWLQTRKSAPVLARPLGVHDQTVRNRQRRLRELFGDALDHPDRSAELVQALQIARALERATPRKPQRKRKPKPKGQPKDK